MLLHEEQRETHPLVGDAPDGDDVGVRPWAAATDASAHQDDEAASVAVGPGGELLAQADRGGRDVRLEAGSLGADDVVAGQAGKRLRLDANSGTHASTLRHEGW